MSIPKISPGDPLKASWANSVASALNRAERVASSEKSTLPKDYLPFDPIALWNDGADWYMKIHPGTFYEIDDSAIAIECGAALSTFPDIRIVPNMNFYFSPANRKCRWGNDAGEGILLLAFEYDGDSFTIENVHPFDVDFRTYPPFTPVFSKNNDNAQTVGLTPGYVCERKPGYDALINHVPDNLLDNGKIKWHPYDPASQQIACIVKVNEKGEIDGGENSGVEIVVELADTTSTHYVPPCADDDEGESGTYHYALAKGFQKVLGGSHIDHFQDITKIDNITNPAGGNQARPISHYDRTENKFKVRLLEAMGGQLEATETAETMQVRGNSKEGSFSVGSSNDDDESDPETEAISLNWSDGLVTSNGAQSISVPIGKMSGKLSYKIGDDDYSTEVLKWKKGLVRTDGDQEIPIPKVVAGTNVTIDESYNVFTINALKDYEEIALMVCTESGPVSRTFLVKKLT